MLHILILYVSIIWPTVSEEYTAIVTPAGWAFAIWSVIFTGEGIFAVWQVLYSTQTRIDPLITHPLL